MPRHFIAATSLVVVALFGFVALGGCSSEEDGGASSGESPAPEATSGAESPAPEAEPVETTPPQATPTPEPEEQGVGDGTHVVGQDIQPGTYRTDGDAFCYLARLSGFGGTLDEILANHVGSGPQIVTISPTDQGFESTGCGEWVVDSGQGRPDPNAPFGEGVYAIGPDVSPGTWRTESGGQCYWARLSGFGRTLDDIITNDNASGAAVVAIGASDVGFEVSGCGEWTKAQ